MAATLPPFQALTYVKEMIKRMPVDRVQVSILQDASSMIWMAAPWRWTIGTFGPLAITAGQSTVTLAGVSSLLRLEKLVISDAVTSRALQVVATLPASPALTAKPNLGCLVPTPTPKVQFENTFPPLPSGDSWNMWGWYKITAPVITNANMNTNGLLLMDDEWFWVFNEAVLYYAYKFADDQRAGGSTVAAGANGTQIQYTGQIGVVHSALEEMRRSESVIPGFPLIYEDPRKVDNLVP